jgi:hypothetical protein
MISHDKGEILSSVGSLRSWKIRVPKHIRCRVNDEFELDAGVCAEIPGPQVDPPPAFDDRLRR